MLLDFNSDSEKISKELPKLDDVKKENLFVSSLYFMESVVWNDLEQKFLSLSADTRPVWVEDTSVIACKACFLEFTFFRRRHHCRNCGFIFCYTCSSFYITLPEEMGYPDTDQRTCMSCFQSVKVASETKKNTRSSKRNQFNEDILSIQNFVRDATEYQFSESLTDIGHRISSEKTFAFLKSKNEAKKRIISSLSLEGIPPSLSSKFIKYILDKMDCHNIVPTLHLEVLPEPKNRLFLIRPYYPKGSLRDLICNAKPDDSHGNKYADKKVKSLPLEQIVQYSYQILQFIFYLQKLGYSFPHLHTSNIFVCEDETTLHFTELENSLLGLRPRYFLERFTSVNVEVECFGHILYEMVFGVIKATLHDTKPGEPVPLLPPCDLSIYSILESIFEPPIDSSPPSIELLLRHPLFSTLEKKMPPMAPPTIGSKAKKMLREASDAIYKQVKSIYKQKKAENRSEMEIMAQESNLSVAAKRRLKMKRSQTVNTINASGAKKKKSRTPLRRSLSRKDIVTQAKVKPATSQAKVVPVPPPKVEVAPLAPPITQSPVSPGRNALLDSIRQNNKSKLKAC